MLFLLLALSMVRGPVVVGVRSDGAYVAWETNDPQSNATVRLGTTAGVYTASIQDSATSEHHHVQLTGLLPATTYHYAIDTDPARQDSTFTTAPAGPVATPIRFVVYGDNRTGTSDHQSVVDAIRREPNISFLVHTGDMAQNYPGFEQWDQFFSVEHELLRSTPIFPAIGNHETIDVLVHWSQFFSPPRFDPTSSVRYYSADFAQIHLAVMDTFDSSIPAIDSNKDTISAAQREWLKADLDAARAKGQLIFASLHHGHASHATGSSAHGGSALVATQVIPELNARGAIAVFAGHDHMYERGCNAGIDYFVAGGGGAPLYPVDARAPGVLFAKSTFEYTVITVQGLQISGVTKDPSGAVLDSFQLPTAGCQFTADGGSPGDAGAGDGGAGGDAGAVSDAGASTDAGAPPPPVPHGSCASGGAAPLSALFLTLLARRRRT
jgi:hypothetical protein